MKLKMYFIMLALGLFSFAIQSCDDDDEDAPVSEQLEKAFTNEFGNVAHNWSTRGTNHVASFNQDNTEKEAWFDANGVWLMTETDIAYDALPCLFRFQSHILSPCPYAQAYPHRHASNPHIE